MTKVMNPAVSILNIFRLFIAKEINNNIFIYCILT